MECLNGLVVKNECGTYVIEYEGVFYRCKTRGTFKKDKLNVLVGDKVTFDDEDFIITSINERKNYLIRPPIANIDQALVVFSLVEPSFSYLLVFKYITYLNSHSISPIIVLTKSDRFIDEDKLSEIMDVFKKLKIPFFVVSSLTGEGIDSLKEIFKNKTTCFMGQTGVGKSSLLNVLDPTFVRKVGSYSVALHRGKHETKEVILLPFNDGYVSDTPGFSSLDLKLTKKELASYFPLFMDLSLKCYYSNCLHLNEKQCEVKKMLEENNYPRIAYDCYLKLLMDIKE